MSRASTAEEFTAALDEEARLLDADYERRFPGFRSMPMGLQITMPEAGETMRRFGFPP